jgi:hypothetical protein
MEWRRLLSKVAFQGLADEINGMIGALAAGPAVGSIRKIGALVQGIARLQRLDLLAWRARAPTSGSTSQFRYNNRFR